MNLNLCEHKYSLFFNFYKNAVEAIKICICFLINLFLEKMPEMIQKKNSHFWPFLLFQFDNLTKCTLFVVM